MKFDISGSYKDLTPEERNEVANLLQARNDLTLSMFELNRMRIQVLRNYTPEGEEGLATYASTVVAPQRDSMSRNTSKLLQSAVDFEGLKSYLPMIAMGLLQNINLPLLLAATGTDPDQVNLMVKRISEFIKSGM